MSISFYEMPPASADEAGRHHAIVQSGALRAAGDRILADIVMEAKAQLRAQAALVSIVQDDYQHLIAAVGLPLGIYSRRTSFCGHAVASGQALFCVPDLTADRRFAGNPYVNGVLASYRFYAAAVLRDGPVALGTLCALDERPRAELSFEEGAALRHLATRVVDRLATLRAAA